MATTDIVLDVKPLHTGVDKVGNFVNDVDAAGDSNVPAADCVDLRCYKI
jgi:hypothetical protein